MHGVETIGALMEQIKRGELIHSAANYNALAVAGSGAV